MYRRKAGTIAQAVSRNAAGHYFSLEAVWNTNLQKRLSYVEHAVLDATELQEVGRHLGVLATYGSVREAVKQGFYDLLDSGFSSR